MSIVSTIIDYLRAGYPDGVPEVDYVPLFALLGSKLTDSEVQAIADNLADDGEPNTAEHIQAAITAATQKKPLEVDIARVRSRLAAGGWPLVDFRSRNGSQNLTVVHGTVRRPLKCPAVTVRHRAPPFDGAIPAVRWRHRLHGQSVRSRSS
jgi:hypothetical protein